MILSIVVWVWDHWFLYALLAVALVVVAVAATVGTGRSS